MIRKPEWMRIKIKGSQNLHEVESLVDGFELNTVCKGANRPNRMKRYESRIATFMILGDICTRNCRYCNVTTGRGRVVDEKESENVAKVVQKLGLKYAVTTSVDRDDLKDEGAIQFKNVAKEVRKYNEGTLVEILIPDVYAKHELLDIVSDERPDVLNYNVEAARSIFKEMRPQGNLDNSFEVLRYTREKGLITKSGFTVGLGETNEEVHQMLDKLNKLKIDMVTIGQCLMPALNHAKLDRYVTPEEFDEFKEYGESIGIKHVESGLFVRSSYSAGNVSKSLEKKENE